jgi:hypothetical protein
VVIALVPLTIRRLCAARWTGLCGILAIASGAAACSSSDSVAPVLAGGGIDEAGGAFLPPDKPWQATTLDAAPSPREHHTAVWTGSRMLVWGGNVMGKPAVTDTGAAYDPTTRTWTPISLTGAPSPRHSHTAVWTGSRMLVWGGFGASSFETTGGSYDPVSDTWTPIASMGAPVGRIGNGAAWVSGSLLVWGGFADAPIATGGRYDATKDAWSAIDASQAPPKRFGHTMLGVGDSALVWGGNDTLDWHRDGALLSADGTTWAPLSTTGAPSAREGATGVWTGALALVWGGFDGGTTVGSGGAFSLATGTWAPLPEDGAPSPRREHVAAWIGARMFVWGGCGDDTCKALLGDGAWFDPSAKPSGTWAPIATDSAVVARRGATAVWTGAEVIVWGGRTLAGLTNTGAQGTPSIR